MLLSREGGMNRAFQNKMVRGSLVEYKSIALVQYTACDESEGYRGWGSRR